MHGEVPSTMHVATEFQFGLIGFVVDLAEAPWVRILPCRALMSTDYPSITGERNRCSVFQAAKPYEQPLTI